MGSRNIKYIQLTRLKLHNIIVLLVVVVMGMAMVIIIIARMYLWRNYVATLITQ